MSQRLKIALSVAAAVAMTLSAIYALADQHCADRGEAFLLHRLRCVPDKPPPVVIERDLRHSLLVERPWLD